MDEETKALLRIIVIELSFNAMSRATKDKLSEKIRGVLERANDEHKPQRLGCMLRLPGKCQKCGASDMA